MKINQNPQFQPITITFETAEEADLFWGFVSGGSGKLNADENEQLDGLRNDISNWFSNQAQLGG